MTQRLSDMYKVLHPRFHLGDTYKEGAYSDMNVASSAAPNGLRP